ncbi:UNVERIFIED_ORG: EAL domain-containing protein (putative c-di-GMP-specific phosphodiesterase class I) [Enterobacter sp. BIGb0239]
MAIEILTVVTHPSNPTQRIAPDRYFAEVSVRQRLDVLEEQLEMLGTKRDFFARHDILASVNVDGPTLIALRQNPQLQKLVASLPWMRFELVEHVRLPQDSSFASMCEFGPLWLDDFGTGMANFSALSEVRYDYIKVARDLFIMLRQTQEGRNLFTLLLQLMNRYCQGVIVEGVETLEEWRDVQNSPAAAAQGYFLSRPVPMDTLDNVIITL